MDQMTSVNLLVTMAFDGEPGYGCRELRLSEEEAECLKLQWPEARLEELAAADCGKQWYRVRL